jgi:hypothetical protein
METLFQKITIDIIVRIGGITSTFGGGLTMLHILMFKQLHSLVPHYVLFFQGLSDFLLGLAYSTGTNLGKIHPILCNIQGSALSFFDLFAAMWPSAISNLYINPSHFYSTHNIQL